MYLFRMAAEALGLSGGAAGAAGAAGATSC